MSSFERRIEEYYERLGSELGWSDRIKREAIDERIRGTGGRHAAAELERYTELRHKKVLDVGSGFGGFIVAANKAGALVLGVEPDQERIELCKMYLELNRVEKNLCVGVGQYLPLKDNAVDVVTCYQVLEHTKNPTGLIREMVRVLKPDGLLHITAPNYLYYREDHYRIFWIPLCPRPVAKLYLKMRKKKSSYFNSINYTTLLSIRRGLKAANIKNIVDITEEKMRNTDAIISPKRRFICKLLKMLHLCHLACFFRPRVQLIAKK